jgi:hypothetical protein
MKQKITAKRWGVFYAALLILVFIFTSPVHAIWHTVLSEHFSGSPLSWPWGNWTIYPNRPPQGSGPPYTWGIQDYIFKSNGIDNHSLWCVGQPNALDPEFDNYPANTNSWAKWGPINLSSAVAARANFWYFYETEPVQDYVRWGAYPSNTFNMYEAGRRSGYANPQWYSSYVDFDSLENGTISLLGQSAVYVLFNFVSDGDAQVYTGAFIDEISIAWDDGIFDLLVQSAGFVNPDSSPAAIAFVGDTIRFALHWAAEGTGLTPFFNITCRLDGQLIYSERRNIDIGDNQVVGADTYSDLWVVSPDSHTVEWMLDASQEIAEASEANNDTILAFLPEFHNVPPWIEVLRPTWGDTAAQTFVIRWQDEDPDNNAYINLFWNFDTLSTNGIPIPGAAGILEDDEADSFLWNVSTLPEGPIWVLAMIEDGSEPFFDYSAGPVIIDHDWVAVSPWNIPAAPPRDFSIQSVYPNPFNSGTVIRIAAPDAAEIELKVFDPLGRQIASPYHGRIEPGVHDIRWSPEGIPAGLYLIELNAQDLHLRAKAVYLK